MNKNLLLLSFLLSITTLAWGKGPCDRFPPPDFCSPATMIYPGEGVKINCKTSNHRTMAIEFESKHSSTYRAVTYNVSGQTPYGPRLVGYDFSSTFSVEEVSTRLGSLYLVSGHIDEIDASISIGWETWHSSGLGPAEIKGWLKSHNGKVIKIICEHAKK